MQAEQRVTKAADIHRWIIQLSLRFSPEYQVFHILKDMSLRAPLSMKNIHSATLKLHMNMSKWPFIFSRQNIPGAGSFLKTFLNIFECCSTRRHEDKNRHQDPDLNASDRLLSKFRRRNPDKYDCL